MAEQRCQLSSKAVGEWRLRNILRIHKKSDVGAFLLLLTKPTEALAQPLPEELVYKLWIPIIVRQEGRKQMMDRERGQKGMAIECGLICIVGYIIIALFAWALCKAAAKGDEQLRIKE